MCVCKACEKDRAANARDQKAFEAANRKGK